MKEYVIIGRVERDKISGPGEVVKSLLAGLQEKNIKFQFINIYNKKKIKVLSQIMMILLKKDVVINIHSFGYKLPYFLLFISKINKRNKYFLTLHGIYSQEALINGIELDKINLKMEGKIIHKFPNIICVSKYMKNYINKIYNTKNNIVYINNGISRVNSESIIKNSNIYLYVGGFNKRKNPLFVVELFAQILSFNHNAKLYMCGDTDDIELYDLVIKTIKTYKMEDSIEILGKITKEELFKLYSLSKYIIAPSKFDTFNMAVLEAMNHGCVPIISPNCGIKDLVTNSGIISLDIKEIIEKLKGITDDRYLELSNLNYEISLKNTYLEMTEKYLKIMNI